MISFLVLSPRKMVDACLALAVLRGSRQPSRRRRVDYIINPFRRRDHDGTTMSAFAFFSTARQFIASSPRLFSSSATLGYPKLKTHSGSKKRWRALASGVFKRVSTVQPVQSAGL
jgi:hypothetical protein